MRDLANGNAPSLTKDRVSLELLQQRGIITLATGNTPHITLTTLGYELRAELHG